MFSLRDHLLRTLAAVPPRSRVLDLECGAASRTVALAQLGFDVHATASDTEVAVRAQKALDAAVPAMADRAITAAPRALGYPDNFFDWVVAVGSYDRIAPEKLADALAETPERLTYRFEASDFAVAEKVRRDESADGPVVRGIFRKIERDVIG